LLFFLYFRMASSNEMSGMRNEDFRLLMMTPKIQETPKAINAQSDNSFAVPKKKKHVYKKKIVERDVVIGTETKYRDRAKERREGYNLDYDSIDVDHILSGFNSVAPPSTPSMLSSNAVLVDKRVSQTPSRKMVLVEQSKTSMQTQQQQQKQKLYHEQLNAARIEASKFLGGDIEHTHLVKGLDYALLQKVRSDLQKQRKISTPIENSKNKTNLSTEENKTTSRQQSLGNAFDVDEEKGKLTENSVNDDAVNDDTSSNIGGEDDNRIKENNSKAKENASLNTDFQAKFHSDSERTIHFATTIGKAVYSILMERSSPKAIESFLPGRTSFVFDLVSKDTSSEIPTIVICSKEDCPTPKELYTEKLDEELFGKLCSIMSYIREGSKTKRKKKKLQGEQVPMSKPTKKADSATTETTPTTINLPKTKGEIFDDIESGLSNAPKISGKNIENLSTSKTSSALLVEDIFTDIDSPSKEESNTYKSSVDMNFSLGSDESITRIFGDTKSSTTKPNLNVTEGMNVELADMDIDIPETDQQMKELQRKTIPKQIPTPTYQTLRMSNETIFQTVPPSEKQREGEKNRPKEILETAKRISLAISSAKERSQEDRDKGVATVFSRDAKFDESFRKRKTTNPKEKDPNFLSESYAECYPGTYETTYEVLEGSDEEADFSKMDMGKKYKLHRWEFASEEAWSSYNEHREALPKAAFQFGIKMSDGRKTKKNNKEKKIDQELKKINQLIKRKENEQSSVPTAEEINKKWKMDQYQ